MSIAFSADEILAVAEQIERNGAKFYRIAAEQTSDGEAQAALKWLAGEEDQHEKAFAAMRANLNDGGPLCGVWDPDGQCEKYLQALADGKVFDLKTDPAVIVKRLTTIRDVLECALSNEKDTIVFYMVMAKKGDEHINQEKIQGILDEEIGHIALISDMLALLWRGEPLT